MAIYAVIRNGVVDNIIVADTVEIAKEATGTDCVELPENGFGVSDLWDGTKFIKSELEVTE